MRRMMIPLLYFLIGIWLMAGLALAEPLGNATAEFILNVTDTIGFDGSRNNGGESRTLIAQNPPEQKVVNIPNVGGMNWREAKALLESLGLRVALNEVQGASMGCDPSNVGKAVSTSAADMWAGGVFGTVRVGTQVTLNYCPDRTEDRCREIDAALVAASQAKDINRFRALVEQARVENCKFYQNAYNHLRNWEQQEGRCKQIDSALKAASQAKDINRFRALVEQARVEKCDFYQNAYNHLRNWEQELQRSSIRPQPQVKPQPPPPDNRKWIVWHDCTGPSFACVLDLSRTTEDELRRNRSGRKITIFGVYNTEQEARRATCGRFTGIRAGGQFAAGTLGNIGKDVYCVKNFFYWESKENRYKCIEVK